MICRGCTSSKLSIFIDLGYSPISNDLVELKSLHRPEMTYPLRVYVCDSCGFVQLPETATREILFPENYVYYSSFSTSWLNHAENYVESISISLGLKSTDLVIEVASNDGYLLQYFQKKNISVLGIEPSREVAKVAQKKGIETIVEFFGKEFALGLSGRNVKANLMIANNVLAHVPDIHDFVAGFEILLADDGVITFEFPHLSKLIENNEFDTIYHEHYSYLSIEALKEIFKLHGLEIFDVESLETHGGSIRLYVARRGIRRLNRAEIDKILDLEKKFSPRAKDVVENFQRKSFSVKLDLLSELIRLKSQGKRIVAYGAAAKGNTLLNYCGIRADLIDYVVDLNPAKQFKYLPGSHIPVLDPSELTKNLPDVILILPWNLVGEIVDQLKVQVPSSVRFLRAIPELKYI